MVQRQAPYLKAVHPQLLEDPPDRFATPEEGVGQLLAALQPQPGRTDFSRSSTGMQWESSMFCMRGASTSAASRKPIYRAANTSRSEATSASG